VIQDWATDKNGEGLPRQHLRDLLVVYRDGLLGDTLPFWIAHSVDRKYGGFLTSLDRDGTVVDTDKGVWQQGRFTWLLAKLYNEVEPRKEWLDLALHGARFLIDHCFDPSDGRMWFHVAQDGQPIRKRRYAYSEAFAAIAFGEIARATGEDGYKVKAKQAFDRFIDHNSNPEGVQPKFTANRPLRGIGFPMITINTAQELRTSIQLPEANHWIDQSIEAIRHYHVHDDVQCVFETVAIDGSRINHYDGRTLNPGHAIEGAWFIMAEGRYRNDQALIELGCKMLDWMWQRGWDQQHGGLLYFTSFDHLPIQEYWHDMKFWWPHNETIIATLMAYLTTGNPKYQQWHQWVHNWSYQHFADSQFGEWFGYLRRDGEVSNFAKGNIWKGPFHLPRMQLQCWNMLQNELPDVGPTS